MISSAESPIFVDSIYSRSSPDKSASAVTPRSVIPLSLSTNVSSLVKPAILRMPSSFTWGQTTAR